jgi:hypothetical protein
MHPAPPPPMHLPLHWQVRHGMKWLSCLQHEGFVPSFNVSRRHKTSPFKSTPPPARPTRTLWLITSFLHIYSLTQRSKARGLVLIGDLPFLAGEDGGGRFMIFTVMEAWKGRASLAALALSPKLQAYIYQQKLQSRAECRAGTLGDPCRLSPCHN